MLLKFECTSCAYSYEGGATGMSGSERHVKGRERPVRQVSKKVSR